MSVFEALLVKACGPLSFILLVQWSHDNIQDEQKIVFNIMASLIITYACWWFIFGNKHGTRKFDSSMLTNMIINEWSTCTFSLYFLLVFNVYENGQQREFITEHVVPFMDVYSLFKCIKHELWCIFYFVYRYTKIIQISFIKCLQLFLYLFLHAVLFLMILDFIYTTCLATTHIFLTDHFSDHYRADLFKDYPAGYGNQLQLETHGNYPAFIRNTFIQDENGTFSKTSFLREKYKNLNGTYLPFNNYYVLRYKGEDVELSCSFLRTNTSKFKVIWLKNGHQTANSNRYVYDTVVECEKYSTKMTLCSVNSKLRILVIQKYDFGKYECASVISEMQNVLNISILFTNAFVISVHNLAELQPERKLIYREVGSLVKLRSFFYYHSFQSDDDISVDYLINGRPLFEQCKGYLSQSCSFGSMLQRVFGSRDINELIYEFDPMLTSAYIENKNIHTAFLKYCICQNGYGIHRLSFRRYDNLKSKKKIKVLEFQHPTAVIILPRTKLSLFRYFDDNDLYKNIENMINNGTHLDVIQTRIDEVLHFISANEGKVLSLANVVQCCITVIILLIINIFLRTFINLYIRYVIINPVRRYIYPSLTYGELPQLPIDFHQYDIIISHTDSDYTFVADVLVPFLERECNLMVCFPDRDFNQGRSIFNHYLDAFDTSRKIIVVLSSEYLSDAQCGSMQLEYMILPLIFEKKKRNHDVLFIKYDETSKIPAPLRWNFDVDVLSWITEVNTNLKLKRIRSWYFTGEL